MSDDTANAPTATSTATDPTESSVAATTASTEANAEPNIDVVSVGADTDVADLFQSPIGPLSGPATQTGSVDDAAKHLGLAVPSPTEFGQITAVGFDDSAVKILYAGDLGTILTVETTAPVFHSSDDMAKLAAQYADAPTTSHPTRVSVVTLEASGATAIAFDPVFAAGPHPNTVRSATFDVGNLEFTVYLTKARDETSLLALADQFAVEAQKAFPQS